MTNIRPFQIALLGIFVFLAILALILVKTYSPSIKKANYTYGDQVVIWGTLNPSVMGNIFDKISIDSPDFNVVKYQYIDERSFDDVFVNAVAEGRSPDLIILKADSLVKHRAKLTPIPYTSLSERAFRDTYIDGAEIFMMVNGVYAIPFAIDPLIMYWNRDLFATGGIATAPSNWETLLSKVVPSLTIRDTSRNIIQSAVAMGEFSNIDNAKAILMSLAMQSGSKLVTQDEKGYEVMMNYADSSSARPPVMASLDFFTRFSDTASPLYTWNRAQASSKNAFIAEDLAIYFGFGSEVRDIADKNPNLNFDVSTIPQGSSATVFRTYGDFYGFAIPTAATNKQGAYAAALTLASEQYAPALVQSLNMASPLRTALTIEDVSPYRQVITKAALVARGWLDPNPKISNEIFATMVEDVVSGRSRVDNAVSDAIRKLTFEY